MRVALVRFFALWMAVTQTAQFRMLVVGAACVLIAPSLLNRPAAVAVAGHMRQESERHVGMWSVASEGLRARLVSRFRLENDRPQLSLVLELENVGRKGPISIFITTIDSMLEMDVENEAGVVSAREPFGGSMGVLPPHWLDIPATEIVSLTVGDSAYRPHQDGRILLRPTTFQGWTMPEPHQLRFLKGTFTATPWPGAWKGTTTRPAPEPREGAWSGRLMVPRVLAWR